jgi:hypothetical protein
MKKQYVIYEQNYEDVIFHKICLEEDLLKALTDIGHKRLKEIQKDHEAWFLGVSIDYTHDNVLNSPVKDSLYLSLVRMKYQKKELVGVVTPITNPTYVNKNFEESLYVSSVESFEKKHLIPEPVESQSILTKTQKEQLSEVYGKLWAEACYDPMNESTRKFASPLAVIMQKLNEDLKFKL